MRISIRRVVTQSRYGVLSLLFALSLVLGTAGGFMAAPTASAQACDPVNIVYCGLDGDTVQANIDSFQNLYNSGSNHGHNDLQAVFRWAGASNAQVAAMSTSNTRLGTIYRNGDIKVGGKTVGHDSWVAARFTEGSGFVKISDGVWARKTTTSFAQASAPVLVHTDQSGTADWAVMTDCGNAVKFTPVIVKPPAPKPQPKPQPQASLTCVSLTATQSETDRQTYNFKAQANADHTTITKYVFDFGDNQHAINTSGEETGTVSHTYAANSTNNSYTARVTVFSSDFAQGKTAAACTVTVTTPTPPAKPTECKPGVPMGSEQCNTPAVLGASTPTPPTQLPHTGASSAAAILSVFGVSTIGGILAYNFWIRRKLST